MMKQCLCLLLLLCAALAVATHAAAAPTTGVALWLADDDPSPTATPSPTPDSSPTATATWTATATATPGDYRLRLPVIISSFVALPTPTPTATPTPTPTPTWIIHNVDRGESAAADPSLALDAAGHPHIAYYLCFGEPPRDCEIREAHYTGSSWVISVVDANPGSSGPSVAGPSIAVDSKKNPHISYYHHGASGNRLVYARWTGTAWETQVVDVAVYANPATSLALDAADRPHIAYYDYTSDEIRYARRTGTSDWQIETIANVLGAGTGVSLALDSTGQPHVVFWVRSYPGFSLRYSFKTGSTWVHRAVALSGRSVVRPALALDAQDRPHIAYGYYNNDLWSYTPIYVRWTGSNWEFTSVGLSTNDMRAISLALDSAGNPRVAYDRLVSGRQTLMYAWWLGGGWAEQALDPEVGWGISLVLDAQGNPHIAYEASGTAGLRYAHRGGP